MTVLSQMQFPGTEHLNHPAEPWEQTPSQFMNRPDVYVHGRYARPEVTHLDQTSSRSHVGFHAGTKQAAYEVLQSHGRPWEGHSAKFFYGRVDPGRLEDHIVDQGTDWDDSHLDRSYTNTEEDKGSTSVILSTGQHNRPNNFQTHVRAVSEALGAAKAVPAHVRAIYDAAGGRDAPEALHDPGFRTGEKPPPFSSSVMFTAMKRHTATGYDGYNFGVNEAALPRGVKPDSSWTKRYNFGKND